MCLKFLKKKLTLLLFFFHSLSLVEASSPDLSSGVTSDFRGGRFGDNLLAISRTVWLSYRLGLPLVYKSFEYGDDLVISSLPQERDYEAPFQYHHNLYTSRDYTQFVSFLFKENLPQQTLVHVPFFPNLPEYTHLFDDYPTKRHPPFIEVNWRDPLFKARMRELISPNKPLKLYYPPPGVFSVAHHLRTGRNFDVKACHDSLPLKFPDIGFYIDGIRYLYSMIKQPLFIRVFTDDSHPEKLLEMIKIGVNNIPIEWSVRDSYSHNTGVLEDFFSLQNFDGLIRPVSNFSLLANRLGCFKIAISPFHFSQDIKTKQNIIDRIKVEVLWNQDQREPFVFLFERS